MFDESWLKKKNTITSIFLWFSNGLIMLNDQKNTSLTPTLVTCIAPRQASVISAPYAALHAADGRSGRRWPVGPAETAWKDKKNPRMNSLVKPLVNL